MGRIRQKNCRRPAFTVASSAIAPTPFTRVFSAGFDFSAGYRPRFYQAAALQESNTALFAARPEPQDFKQETGTQKQLPCPGPALIRDGLPAKIRQ